MRCMDCGAEMRLVDVVGDPTMMVRGFEHHTFECAACRVIERRRVFNRARNSPTGRIVRIGPDDGRANYFASTRFRRNVIQHWDDSQGCGSPADAGGSGGA